MLDKKALYVNVKEAIIAGDREKTIREVEEGLKGGLSASDIIEKGMSPGMKEVGERFARCLESKESWQSVLRDLKRRGLRLGRLTIADGHLGIWSALGEIHPEGEEQRCWNHKIQNVLDAYPKRIRSEAKEFLCKIPYVESQRECERLRDAFVLRYQKNYPKAARNFNPTGSGWSPSMPTQRNIGFIFGRRTWWNLPLVPFGYGRMQRDDSKK
jgi:putative transposase